MEKRETKRDLFGEVLGYVEGNQKLVDFINREIELLSKKSGAETKTQKENRVVADFIYGELASVEDKLQAKEILALDAVANYTLENGNGLTIQKVSAILKKLVADGRVVRTEDKGVAYFSVNAE